MNDHIYGIFFEDINHAGDGGLYGELIRNRDFEASKMPEGLWYEGDEIHNVQGWQERAPFSAPRPLVGWFLLPGAEERASIARDNLNPLSTKNPFSPRFNVRKQDLNRAGFYNTGYWGINVEKGKRRVASRGTAEIMTSESRSDENSLENPDLIRPVTVALNSASNRFDYTFVPNSLTVMRLKLQ